MMFKVPIVTFYFVIGNTEISWDWCGNKLRNYEKYMEWAECNKQKVGIIRALVFNEGCHGKISECCSRCKSSIV
jgi:hypothetical protein